MWLSAKVERWVLKQIVGEILASVNNKLRLEPHYSSIYWLCKALKDPACKLKKLSSTYCSLTDPCYQALAAALQTNQSLEMLDLSCNDLGDHGVQQLCEGLKHNCKLQSLNLCYCSLTDSCCEDLAAALQTRHGLKVLDLSCNDLGDHGVHLLCEGLKQNCKLQSLNLRYCSLTDSCCEDLAAALQTNQTLEVLDLNCNDLGDHGVQRLCEGLKQNCKLQSLNLSRSSVSHFSVTDAGCRDLAALLKTSRSLTKLDLGGHKLGNAGVRVLCEGLIHQNCKLEALGLAICCLTDSCCEVLATALRINQSLMELDLCGNKVGEHGVHLLCEGLKQNCKLQSLKIEYSCLIPEMQAQMDAVRVIRPDFHIKDCSEED